MLDSDDDTEVCISFTSAMYVGVNNIGIKYIIHYLDALQSTVPLITHVLCL